MRVTLIADVLAPAEARGLVSGLIDISRRYLRVSSCTIRCWS